MLRDCARRAARPRPFPLAANHPKCGDKADTGRFDLCLVGDALHLEPDQIVGEQDAPHFLLDASAALAANSFLTLEYHGLHLAEVKLNLPACVIERDELFIR